MSPPAPTGLVRSRILVADDHPVFLDALSITIARADDLELVAAAGCFEAVRAALRDTPVDLALIDLRMPGMAGAASVAALRAEFPAARIAIISGSVDAADIRQALQAGAVGYVPKTFGPASIVAAVRLMLAGAIYVPPEILESPEVPSGAFDSLTPREREILALVARGLSNKQIARHVGVAEVTVKLHIRGFLTKLKARNRAGAVAAALALGVMREGD